MHWHRPIKVTAIVCVCVNNCVACLLLLLLSQISYSSAAPLSEIPSAKVDRDQSSQTTVETAKAPPQGAKSGDTKPEVTAAIPITAGVEDHDAILDGHFLYSMKDFQPFQSKTYYGKYIYKYYTSSFFFNV